MISSKYQFVNLHNADIEIHQQFINFFAEKMLSYSNSENVLCMVERKKLIGCVSLQMVVLEEPLSLARKINGRPVYALTIEILEEYQGKGYGRKLFNFACQSVTNQGALIYIVDKTHKGIGTELYGGQKTCQLFNVSILFKGSRGEYLLSEKTEDTLDLNYLKFDPADKNYRLFLGVKSIGGMKHIIRYLETFPEERHTIHSKIFAYCQKCVKIYKKIWKIEEHTQYEKLVKTFLQMVSRFP